MNIFGFFGSLSLLLIHTIYFSLTYTHSSYIYNLEMKDEDQVKGFECAQF